MADFDFLSTALTSAPKAPPKVSSRAFRSAIEEAFIGTYTRQDLETVLGEELSLPWPVIDTEPSESEYTKRDVLSLDPPI